MLSTLMLVGLGFLTASLVALLIVPWVWRRAVKVTGRRLQFAAPDSVVEIQADRDQLRAEHALSTRKLEIRLQELKEKLAHQAVERSEHMVLTDRLNLELENKDKEIAGRDNQIEQLRASMSPIETELASRTATTQQLGETINKLEDKVHEQEVMIKQTAKAAGLKDADIEALREASRLDDASGTVLLPGLASTQETLTEQVAEFSHLAAEMEQRRQHLFQTQAQLDKQKQAISGSKTISAQEAKDYQARIAILEADRNRLDADLKGAAARTAALHVDIDGLDVAWQNRDNPYRELKHRISAVIDEMERVSKAFNREGIVKTVLAALPGGKSATAQPAPPPAPSAPQAIALVPKPAPQAPAPTSDAAAIQLPPSEPPQLEPANKPAKKQVRSKRVRSLAERIRALQDEVN